MEISPVTRNKFLVWFKLITKLQGDGPSDWPLVGILLSIFHLKRKGVVQFLLRCVR